MSSLRLFPERIEGRHVLVALLGFFGLMLAVNGIFLFYALNTFNGFEARDAYRRGLSYNERIANDLKQAQRGWQTQASYDTPSGRLITSIRDIQGRAVAGLSLSLEIRRPATDREDRALALKEVRPGRYEGEANLAPGQWIVIGEARRGGGVDAQSFRFKQRLWVKEVP